LVEDAIILLVFLEYGCKWSLAAKLLGNGRTDNAVKNRFYHYLSKLDNNVVKRNAFLSKGLNLTDLVYLQHKCTPDEVLAAKDRRLLRRAYTTNE